VAKSSVEPEVLRVRPRARVAYLLLAPALAVLAVFFIYPILWTLFVSTVEYDPVTASSRSVGVAHYRHVLSSAAVWRSILNTAYFSAVYVPLTFAAAGLLALLLRGPVLGRPLLKTVFCSPCVIPTVAAALIWRAAYMPRSGSLDRVLYMLGFEHGPGWSGWLGEPYLAMPCIALMCAWRDTGFFALILLAALGRVPREAHELARADGASKWQTFCHVTAPLCAGTVALCLVMLFINVLNVFQEIYVMTDDGGPANWTVNIPFLIYRKVYLDQTWGTAAVLSVILFTVTVIVILIQNRMLNRRLDWS
jgi:multiple sugar transport system permease protein